jgi:hypothetical protein
MDELWLHAAFAVTAVLLTYLFCVRPMRRGHGCGQGSAPADTGRDDAVDREIARLRAEVARLRQGSGTMAGSITAGGNAHPSTPRDDT